ncbi:MAG: electron transfer flavoprotein subunit alpha/FixB family protein [Dehalococcoidia bacterium]|nr:MAG: electron transfer flavoprotein subunit alpha/FixB family protein [Dehalococcoidia bacterium]
MGEGSTGGVWVIVDHSGDEVEDVSLELLGQARDLADRLGLSATAVLLGDGVRGLAPLLGQCGADTVYLAESPLLSAYNPDAYAPVLTGLTRRQQPSIILWGATDQGRDLAPRVAARLGTGLSSNCTRVDLSEDGLLVMTRPVYGGKASCNVVCSQARPQMATLQPGALPVRRPDTGRQAQVIAVNVSLSAQNLRLRLEEVIKIPPSDLDVTEAEVIVAGGRGVGSKEGFHLIEQLAHLVGAAVAASRPAVDAGWAPYERQVGLSGKTVAPRLYIACGISGVNHHVVGMRDSRAVVAIDQDAQAPIFQMADLKIVGDLHELLPSLIERLRRLRQERGSAEDEEILRTLANVPSARQVS